MEILFLFSGVALGVLVVYFFLKSKNAQSEKLMLAEKSELDKQKSVAEERVSVLQKEKLNLENELKELRQGNEEKGQRLARAEEEFRNLREKLQTQKQEMEELQKKFTTEFENVANRILKKNSAEFTETNQKNINDILSPLKEKIQLFEKKVEETYEKGLKDQTDLKAELKKLQDLNLKISDDANNLTKALKGDVKKQGNWGEVILERILERSGLMEGREYEKQESVISEDSKRFQPDIVIHLPENKHIIVDSKVSLVAYERLVNATDEDRRQVYVKEHLLSLKTHIRGLSEKHYQNSPNFNSPDFVLLFIPIESSFSIAIQEDQELFSYAWDNKVVIVSPSTLLATLRTIASIWQQENQTRNALEIARQGGALYDKFVGFVDDLETIGKNLDTTRKNYDSAYNKLKDGRGNLIRSAEKLRELGAKTSKELPQGLAEE
ncbi:MAG: DNA polymerase V [Bacteroidetes bacterium GWF2_42_66]|nr:MAG: DNA polymerase V [Bacteroidetes bacterium GWA2_42_15]OFY01765.1 MAG: DNA polymerase V [Bacteroidetes bacterium GWE2_42_39]OFY44943.1 MAG: DNA polymerase V [Bacteroidetes bacterium GWF2_42_66]HBL76076.1 DNA recombination protein RmuC [Prolixibacteraceae bacterium]HCR90207.1 DNA recombination protein RmuC [Prolixibacteraceae bacterium]